MMLYLSGLFMFMKTKYKVNEKFHNMKSCLFFPMIWIRIHSEVTIQNLSAMYCNIITLAPMTLFIMCQECFEKIIIHTEELSDALFCSI